MASKVFENVKYFYAVKTDDNEKYFFSKDDWGDWMTVNVKTGKCFYVCDECLLRYFKATKEIEDYFYENKNMSIETDKETRLRISCANSTRSLQHIGKHGLWSIIVKDEEEFDLIFIDEGKITTVMADSDYQTISAELRRNMATNLEIEMNKIIKESEG